MLPQQTPYMPPREEARPEMASPQYNDQFVETLAQRLMPRLMPEIQYNLRELEPARQRNKALGMSLALAIVTLALMIPLTAIILGVLVPIGGIGPSLIGLGVICVTVLLVNILFNYWMYTLRAFK